MSRISSGIGLVSGLPIQDIINQLITIERRPLDLVQRQIQGIQAERSAFLDLSARLLSIKSAISRFDQVSLFRANKATSSNPNVLTATAGAGAVAGSQTFRVHSLVTSHQLLSRGLPNTDQASVGAGPISIEIGGGRISRQTRLETLNGQEGVRRGTIRITDRSGSSADVDLTSAVTVDDVIGQINAQTGIRVEASVSGDRIVIEDLTGQSAGNLSVRDLAGGHAAEDLGLSGSASQDTLTGGDIVRISETTSLDALNDGNGVRRARAGGDLNIVLRDDTRLSVAFDGVLRSDTPLDILNGGEGVRLGTVRVTLRSGDSTLVDLNGARTVQDIVDAFNGAGIALSATPIGSHLQLADQSGGEDRSFAIEDVSGFAARDLGLIAEADGAVVRGNDIHYVTTVGDVLRAINHAAGNNGKLTASISADGNSIHLDDQSRGIGILYIAAVTTAGVTSQAGEDLGILGQSPEGQLTSRRLLAGLNTVLLRSLNGGAGVSEGVIRITTGDGATHDVDLTGAQTVQEILDVLNDSAAGVEASYNAAGTGLSIRDTSGGSGSLSIADVSGKTAADLNINTSAASGVLESGNLQVQYVSGNTRVADLNYGRGIRPGQLAITARSGASLTLNLSGNDKTLQDLINTINALANGIIEASLNETGDGLLITDRTSGAGRLEIRDVGNGTTARDLRIAGQAEEGSDHLDGSYEARLDISGQESLDDVVRRINELGIPVSASVVSDGSSFNPYRLSLTSGISGTRGQITFDAGGTNLNLETLVRGRDAVVFLGAANDGPPVVITSSTNTLTNIIPNVTIELLAASEAPVQVTVAKDIDRIVADIRNFVTAYNSAADRINQLTDFDQEANTRGILFSDSTVSAIEARLRSALFHRVQGVDSQFNRLASIGLGFASSTRVVPNETGAGDDVEFISSEGRIEFDEAKFREALVENPEAVEALFTQKAPEEETGRNRAKDGAGRVLKEALDDLTNSFDGLITRRARTLESQSELLSQRADSLNISLDKKRARLEAQFAALESALSTLQGQQNALAGLIQSTLQ